MNLWQMIKAEPGIPDFRLKMAAEYRRLRGEDRSKALFLFKRMLVARAMTERAVIDNINLTSRPRFAN